MDVKSLLKKLKDEGYCITPKTVVKILATIFFFGLITLFIANFYVSGEFMYSLLVSFFMTIVMFIFLLPLLLLLPTGVIFDTIIYKFRLKNLKYNISYKYIINVCYSRSDKNIGDILRVINASLKERKIDFHVVDSKFITRKFTAFIGDNFIIVCIRTKNPIIRIHSLDIQTLKYFRGILIELKDKKKL